MTKARGDQLQELITAVLVCVTVRRHCEVNRDDRLLARRHIQSDTALGVELFDRTGEVAMNHVALHFEGRREVSVALGEVDVKNPNPADRLRP